MTGESIGRLDWTWSTTFPLAWFALRRQKLEWVPDDLDAFVDLVDIQVWDDAPDEPGEQGKVSAPEQPTG